MKKLFIIIAFAFVSFLPSCTEYLDAAPESGLTEEEVFSKYANFTKYFEQVYTGKSNYNILSTYPQYIMSWDQKWGMNTLTDIQDNGRALYGTQAKTGLMTDAIVDQITYSTYNRPILNAMFKVIRVCNKTLKEIDNITDAPEQVDIEDIRAQAYFVRAYAHYTLTLYWGAMPYIRNVIGSYDDWDIPRIPVADVYDEAVKDLDSSYAVFAANNLVRRDPGPGIDGHLNDPKQNKPSGMIAKALKARILLYKASPLNNKSNNIDWYKDAAEAASEVLKMADQYQYSLLPFDEYSNNFRDYGYTNEHIWAHNKGNVNYNSNTLKTVISGVFANNTGFTSGCMPTQNMVDMYETIEGDPLYTAEQRAEATAKGTYNEQNPYVNRDPRFYHNVYFNQAPLEVWGKINKAGETDYACNIFYTKNSKGGRDYATHLKQNFRGVTFTGYYYHKTLGDLCYKRANKNVYITEPLIRLAEIYLDYAEAANEAYGPNTAAPGATLTAVQAVNIIRERAGMPPVHSKYCTDTETFRDRIQNERTVEFDEEGFHRYHDIRRWMIAPKVMNSNLYGMDIEKLDAQTPEYPTGFKYTRVLMPSDRQGVWKPQMYYWPFKSADYLKFKDFDTSLNPQW